MHGDPDNNDYEKLLLHHVATNVMLLTCNYGGNHRWGSIILILHDAVDIFVSISRMFNSMENYGFYAVTMGYIPLCIIYPYLKLYYFGWLNYGIWFIVDYRAEIAWMNKYLKCKAFLNTCLWILHIVWYKGIIDIGLRIVMK